MSSLMEKIEEKLVSLGIVKLAESGSTSGETIQVTSAAPGVVVSEIIPATIKISYSAIGAPVIQTDADGKEEHVTDGEYILTTNKKITVENGKLLKEEDVEEIEIEDPEMTGLTEMSLEQLEVVLAEVEVELAKKPTEEIVEKMACKKKKILAQIDSKKTEMAKYPWDKCIADQVKGGYSKEVAAKICGKIKADGTKMSIEEVVEILNMANVERQRLADLIDLNKSGDYTINIHVEDGAITYGTLYTSTYENLLMAETQKYDAEFEKLTLAYENIIEALKVGTSTDLNKPISDSSQSQTKLSRVEVLKAQLKNK